MAFELTRQLHHTTCLIHLHGLSHRKWPGAAEAIRQYVQIVSEPLDQCITQGRSCPLDQLHLRCTTAGISLQHYRVHSRNVWDESLCQGGSYQLWHLGITLCRGHQEPLRMVSTSQSARFGNTNPHILSVQQDARQTYKVIVLSERFDQLASPRAYSVGIVWSPISKE